MSAFKRIQSHVVYIDFDQYVDSRLTVDRNGYIAYQLASILGPKRRFPTPQALSDCIEKYFNSCLGPIFTRSGMPITDADGNPVIKVVKPYTVSGLARALGVTTQALMQFKYMTIMSGIPDEYLPILSEARQRIEEYSETRLYDNDGSKGAQFALGASFGWETPKDRSDRMTNRARTKLMREEHAAKMNMLENGEGDGSGINIIITRAGQNNSLAQGDLPTQLDTDSNDSSNEEE
jgi:hypothetical protein